MSWKKITFKQFHEPTQMSTCLIPCPESSPTPSHMPKPNATKISSFQYKRFLFSKTHYRISINTLDYPPRRIAGYFSEIVMVCLRDELLDNSPRQFFGKSFVEISFTNIFVFLSISCHALTPNILGCLSAYGMHDANPPNILDNIFTCIYINIIKSHKSCYVNSPSITPKLARMG